MIKKIIIILAFGVSPYLVCFAQKDVLERQARDGSIEAQLYLGDKYLNGKDGYEKNKSLAFKYYHDAAIQGNEEAQWFIYTLLDAGEGVEKNQEEALNWLEKSARKDYPLSLLRYGIYKYSISQYEDAIKLLQKFENKYGDHPFIWEVLGTCYKEGTGVKVNYTKSIEYYQKCVAYNLEWKKEHPNEPFLELVSGFAAYCLGEINQYGLGKNKDLDQAKKLYNFAISEDPDNYSYHEALGGVYIEEQNYDKAREIWAWLIKNNPDIVKSNSILANALGESIDYIIPTTLKENQNFYAIIIANENYKRVPNVPHAINDGAVFKKYLTSTFGVPEENIEYLEDASLNDIKYALSNVSQRCDAFKDQLSVIVYYAGHGVPDDKTNEAYLLPVDGFGTDPKSGLNMEDFYESLSEMSAKSVIVLLDACFSGAKRDGGMLMATRGITIKPNMKVPDGKLIVLSATAEDQTAFPIEEQKHGLFTYTLLRKIQETKGDITWGELADYVTENVKTRSIDLAGKLQSPTVSVSPSIKDSWRNQKIR